MKRQDLQPGIRLESTAPPAKGTIWELFRILPKGFHRTYIEYELTCVKPQGQVLQGSVRAVTYNHIKKYLKIVTQ